MTYNKVCRFAFESSEEKDFTMALKDMNMASYIGDLIEIGVKSLKVEGRMRSLYYLKSILKTFLVFQNQASSSRTSSQYLKIQNISKWCSM